MRLTQIKLSGFKSFVDPTSIQIPGQLVGVVGPNGCGKSNVIDAVRWVLGESRASALRGDSMQDVIFNGSGNRKPLARASVELIFDNAQGRAAGQWSQYAEISVKRTLQRDGESSYFVNGTHVRRRDITDMFLGTGLGPRAYAIIEQGMISRVIEAKPEELRVFLEEAAGISRYKERRRETENRLADTRENLARVTDIRLELAAQLEKLEAQAKVATRYKEYHADLQLKQHLLWYLRRRDAAAERERHAQEIAKATNALEAETAALRSVESQVETARATHYAAGDALNTTQGALYAANAEVARFESELRHAEETRSRLESQYTERRAQLTSWREQRAQLTHSLHAWAARAGGGEEAGRRNAQQAGSGKRAAAAGRAGRPRGAGSARRRAQRAGPGGRPAAGGAGQLRAPRARRRSRWSSAASASPRSCRRWSSPMRMRSRCSSPAWPACGEELENAQRTFEALQAEHAAVEEQRAAAAEALGVAQREHAAAQAQLDTLRQIQAATEENAPLQEWLGRHGLAQAARLWQKLRIDHGWETAVESVLRERLHALELTDASRLSAALSDQPPVKASVFDHGSHPSNAPVAGLPLASKMHVSDPAVAGAVADWLAGVVAVEGTPDARMREALAPGTVMVNREGHQFTRHTVSFHAPGRRGRGPARAPGRDRGAGEALQRAGRKGSQRGGRAGAAGRKRLAAERVARPGSPGHFAAAEGAARRADRRPQARPGAGALPGAQHAGARRARRGARRRRSRPRGAGMRASRRRRASARRLRACARAPRRRARRCSPRRARSPRQRQAAQQAEREAQDALFGERECGSKIAEIDNSVRVIDQQIGRGDTEVARLNEELAADPIPAVRASLESAVEARIACEKNLAEARNAVEAAAGVLRELEEAKLQAEARAAPLRERMGELRLKEQAAQINFDQFASQLTRSRARTRSCSPPRRPRHRAPPACRARSRALRRRSTSSAR